jgi:hypothetical protein
MSDYGRFKKLAGGGLQRGIAADVWPNGGILSCGTCGFSERITSAMAGFYLANGWPMHCRTTMSMKQAAPRAGAGTGETTEADRE